MLVYVVYMDLCMYIHIYMIDIKIYMCVYHTRFLHFFLLLFFKCSWTPFSLFAHQLFLSVVICCPLLEREGKSMLTAVGPEKLKPEMGLSLICSPSDGTRKGSTKMVCV